MQILQKLLIIEMSFIEVSFSSGKYQESIYSVQSPIALNFEGPQTSHFSAIFEKVLGIILFYVNKSACHILVMICEPCRIPTAQCQNLNFRVAPESERTGCVLFLIYLQRKFFIFQIWIHISKWKNFRHFVFHMIEKNLF